MEQFLIVVMLAGCTHAFFPVADTDCNVTRTQLCTVTVGGCVYIQVMSNSTGYRLQCKKTGPHGNINVFSMKNGNVKIQEPLRNRTEFFISNGTLKISCVEENDSGQYSIEVHDTQMIQVTSISFYLDVKKNIYPILILVVASVCAVLVLVLCGVVCKKCRHRKRSG